MERAVPKEISRELLRWNIIASFHRIVYVALGLIGVLCPLAVAAFADSLGTPSIRVLSFAASGAGAVFAIFDIGNLTTRWREAWKRLNVVRLEYEQGVVEIDALIKAYQDGLSTIGKMDADLFSKVRTIKPDKT